MVGQARVTVGVLIKRAAVFFSTFKYSCLARRMVHKVKPLEVYTRAWSRTEICHLSVNREWQEGGANGFLQIISAAKQINAFQAPSEKCSYVHVTGEYFFTQKYAHSSFQLKAFRCSAERSWHSETGIRLNGSAGFTTNKWWTITDKYIISSVGICNPFTGG